MGKLEEPVHRETLPVVMTCFNSRLTPRPVSRAISKIIFSFFVLLFLDVVVKMSRTQFAVCFLGSCLMGCFASFCCFVFN